MKKEFNKSKKPDPAEDDDYSVESNSDGKIVPEPLSNMYFDFDISGNDPGNAGTELDEEEDIIWDEDKDSSIFNALRGDYVDPDDYNSE